MPLPTDYDTVTVTGKFTLLDGSPAQGKVRFTGKVVVTSAATKTNVVPTSIVAILDANGSFSVPLPATDDPDIQPNGWTYRVQEELTTGGGRTYEMVVPIAAKGSGLDLSTVAPIAPSMGDPTAFVTSAALVPVQVKADDASTKADAALPRSGGNVTGRLTVNGWSLPMVQPNRRVGWRDASSIITSMQAGHGWVVSGTVGSSNLNDTAVYTRGSQSASMTTNGAGAQANLRRLGMPALNLTGKALRLVLRVSDYTRLSTLNFFVGTGGLANTFKWRFNAITASNQIGLANEWVVVTLQFSELNAGGGTFSISSTGVPSTTSGFTDLQFQVVDNGTGPVTVWLQAVEVIDSVVTTWPKGVVSVTFDDSNDSARLVQPKMDALGFRGTQYTIADAIGTPGKLTMAELKSLQDMSGWEIAGHSYASSAHTARYPSLTAQQVDDDARNLKAWLVSNGFTGDSFAYPGGRYELTTDGVLVEKLVARYFGNARTILSNVNVSTHASIDAIPAAMPHRMRGMSSVSSLSVGSNNPTTLMGAGGMLDKVAANGGHLALVFHGITVGAPTDPVECSVADYNAIMDAIAARGIPVLPVSDVVRRSGL